MFETEQFCQVLHFETGQNCKKLNYSFSKYSVSDSLDLFPASVHTADTDKTRQDKTCTVLSVSAV